MWPNKRKEQEIRVVDLSELLSDGGETIDREKALSIPAVAGCCEFITSTVASLPIRLYRQQNDEVTEQSEDQRVALLNGETGDLLDAYQMRKAWIRDTLLDGAGYLYIERRSNQIQSLRYVDCRSVSSVKNADPIFKIASISVGGKEYRDFDFIRLLRNTRDGVKGSGILQENEKLLLTCWYAMNYEQRQTKSGGLLKGFLLSEKPLEDGAFQNLKQAFRTFRANAGDDVIAINSGVTFKEAAATAAEMQINENKGTNAVEVCKVFCVPPSILDGTAKDEDYLLAVKLAVAPMLTAIEKALDRALLLEDEKQSMHFAFDTRELLKGDILKRYQAYTMAVQANIMQVDEVRYQEDLPALGLDFVKMGLQDVLYDPVKKTFFTPNTGIVSDLSEKKSTEKKDGQATVQEVGKQPLEGAAEVEKIAQVSLNGAQIASILQVIGSVGRGEIERDSALELLTSAFPFGLETAEKILGHPKPIKEGKEVKKNEG